MKQEYWWSTIQFFFDKHPLLFKAGEQAYTPRTACCFYLEGNLGIRGNAESLIMNLNSHDILVLISKVGNEESVFRVPWERLISFELTSRATGVTEMYHDPDMKRKHNLIH